MRRLPREFRDPRGPNACPRCGKIHSHAVDGCNSGARHSPSPVERVVREIRKERREPCAEPRREECFEPRFEPRLEERREPCFEPRREERREPCFEPRREERREPRFEPRHDQHRCPRCRHEFVWPPEPCPRCGKLHENRRTWVSPGASSFEPDAYERPSDGGFSRLFGGGNAMLGILLMMMLFGSGINGISEIRQLFMHPMFQFLDIMGKIKDGNLMDAFEPVLGGSDMSALGNILAALGKDRDCG